MAEESQTAVAEPEEQVTLKDFGDLSKVFDEVFPATAEKKEEPVAAVPPPEPAAAPVPEPEKKEAPAPAAAKDELPDFLTGKKPEEKPVVPEPELPAPSPKDSVGMKQLRLAHDRLLDRFRVQEGELKTLKETPAPQTAPDAEARIKHLEAQNQELSGAVERGAIEFHPGFRAEFVTKREQMVGDAHQILKDAQVDPVQWDRAMSLTGQARTEALEAIYDVLPRSSAAELGAAAREIRSLDSRKEAFLADRKGLRERLEQETMQQQRTAMQQHEKNTLEMMDLAEKDLIDRMGIEVYKKSDNPEHKKWNESVERMKADAKKLLLETDDPSVMARAALMAPAAIQYRYLYHTMRDRWLESEKKLAAIEKAEPVITSKEGATSSEDDKKLSFADAVAKSVFHQ